MTPIQPPKPHILVVDDDRRIRELLGRYLQQEGFLVTQAPEAATARNLVDLIVFDAIVLDVMMPGEDGLQLATFWRDTNFATPVLLLTAKGETADRIAGLEAGAADYLPKPFEPRELSLRLKSLLRRTVSAVPAEKEITIGGWHFDATRQLLERNDESELLTKAESMLLGILLQKPGTVFSRQELAKLTELEGQERTIDVQVTRLRRKLEADPGKPRHLQTVRGEGYVLHAD